MVWRVNFENQVRENRWDIILKFIHMPKFESKDDIEKIRNIREKDQYIVLSF